MSRFRLARWYRTPGIWALLERLPRRPGLIVLDYHRVGAAASEPYDPGVFSVTQEELTAHADFLKSHYPVVDLPEVIRMVTTGKWPSRSVVMITFDDGYKDNYDVAFPILAERGLPATFFLASSMVGASELPWWDSIAFIVKNARRRQFALRYPMSVRVDLDSQQIGAAVRSVLHPYRTAIRIEHDRFMSELEAACDCERPVPTSRLFIDWDEARRMIDGGMTIGSHSHSHRLMSRLTPAEQYEEAVTSRAILGENLGTQIDAFAYPVGHMTAFSPTTMDAVRRAGYQVGFSFCTGVNRQGAASAFDLKRLDMGVVSELPLFRSRLSVAASFAR